MMLQGFETHDDMCANCKRMRARALIGAPTTIRWHLLSKCSHILDYI